jgi:acetyl esterase/lipase
MITIAIETLAPFLVDKGHCVCLIEYRRCGEGGGWPNTNTDILVALRRMHMACNDLNLNIQKHILVGHSAGGNNHDVMLLS